MTPDLPNVEIAIIEMTNDFRRQSRLSELKRNRTLDQAARKFASYLARTGKFSHTADGRRPADRTKAVGYRHCRIAENLALNVDSRGFRARQLARGAVEGWKNSPPHRKAMVDPFVTEIGVGVIKATKEHRYLSVQLFGRPKALQYRFTIRNMAAKRVGYSQSGRHHELPPRTEVQHTECNPASLRFERVRQANRQRSGRAEFATRDGDLFVVRASRTGNLVVEHYPRVN
ncbi:MAG: CAP domain-containing protein [Hyphomicrobiaceae bacterium]